MEYTLSGKSIPTAGRSLFIGLLLVTLAQAQVKTNTPFSLRGEAQLQKPNLAVLGPGDSGYKSPGKAFFMSLVLPGSGEYYAGHSQSAPYFFSAEVLLWLSVLANNSYEGYLTDTYKTYAVQHASVSRAGKASTYWSHIGKYDDIYSYNDQRQRDRYFDEVYAETADNYWSWDSRDNRLTYDRKRLDANTVATRVVYMQALVMLNHITSAIHAMYRARKHNKSANQELGWNLNFESSPVVSESSVYRARLSLRF